MTRQSERFVLPFTSTKGVQIDPQGKLQHTTPLGLSQWHFTLVVTGKAYAIFPPSRLHAFLKLSAIPSLSSLLLVNAMIGNQRPFGRSLVE